MSYAKAASGAVPPVIASFQPSGRGRDLVRATSNDVASFSTPAPDVVNGGNGNYFEALRDSKDRSGIQAAMIHMRPTLLRLLNGLNRKMLAAVARYLVDNGGMASYAVNQIANYTVPVFPQAQTEDMGKNTLYEDYFTNWQKRADFTNRFTFENLQRIACIAIDVDGDIGANMDASAGFPQLRLFDTFHIGMLTGLDPKDGVEIDPRGVMRGFHVVDGPVDTMQGIATRLIPTNEFILLRDVDRYNNYRGFSPMRMGSNDLRDAADIKAFTKLKEKLGAALGGVIQQNGMTEEDVWGDDTGNPPDSTASPSAKKLSLAELLGGDIVTIDGELKLVTHQSPGTNTIEFLNFLASQFVCGLGIPPAFFLDEKLTGPNVRSVIGKIERKLRQRKAMIAQLVEFCWIRVIAWGISNKELPEDPNFWKIKYQYQPLLTIDIGDMMANEREDVACGQMSEQERFGNRGLDWQREKDQMFREAEYTIKKAQDLAVKYKLPVELILARYFSSNSQKSQGQGQGNNGNGQSTNLNK